MFALEITGGVPAESMSPLVDAIDIAGDANMRPDWLCSRNDALGTALGACDFSRDKVERLLKLPR